MLTYIFTIVLPIELAIESTDHSRTSVQFGQGAGAGTLGPGAGAGTPWARGLGAPGPKMWDTRGDSNYRLSGRLPTVRQAISRYETCTQHPHTLHPNVSAYMHPNSAYMHPNVSAYLHTIPHTRTQTFPHACI